MLNQMRDGEGEGEGEGAEGVGQVEDIFRRLLGHMPGFPAENAPSPQNALNESLYQAVRAGDLEEAKKALASGTQSDS